MTNIQPAQASAIARAALMVLFTMLPLAASAQAQPATADQEDPAAAEMRKLNWQHGPTQAELGTHATIKVPDQAGYIDTDETQKFLKLTGNLPDPGSSVMVYGDWWASFDFGDVGYIKDDETLDPAALLQSMRDNEEEANKERSKLGYQAMHPDGWVVQPHYDPATHHLEWGLRLKVDGEPEPIVNYTVRLLGRNGYEAVTLVTTQKTLDHDIDELRTVLKTFEFKNGEKYSEWKPGDHVAEIGLGALVAGGAAAAVVKTGLWKGILAALAAGWKLVVAGVVAVGAATAKLFKRKG